MTICRRPISNGDVIRNQHVVIREGVHLYDKSKAVALYRSKPDQHVSMGKTEGNPHCVQKKIISCRKKSDLDHFKAMSIGVNTLVPSFPPLFKATRKLLEPNAFEWSLRSCLLFVHTGNISFFTEFSSLKIKKKKSLEARFGEYCARRALANPREAKHHLSGNANVN